MANRHLTWQPGQHVTPRTRRAARRHHDPIQRDTGFRVVPNAFTTPDGLEPLTHGAAVIPLPTGTVAAYETLPRLRRLYTTSVLPDFEGGGWRGRLYYIPPGQETPSKTAFVATLLAWEAYHNQWNRITTFGLYSTVGEGMSERQVAVPVERVQEAGEYLAGRTGTEPPRPYNVHILATILFGAVEDIPDWREMVEEDHQDYFLEESDQRLQLFRGLHTDKFTVYTLHMDPLDVVGGTLLPLPQLQEYNGRAEVLEDGKLSKGCTWLDLKPAKMGVVVKDPPDSDKCGPNDCFLAILAFLRPVAGQSLPVTVRRWRQEWITPEVVEQYGLGDQSSALPLRLALQLAQQHGVRLCIFRGAQADGTLSCPGLEQGNHTANTPNLDGYVLQANGHYHLVRRFIGRSLPKREQGPYDRRGVRKKKPRTATTTAPDNEFQPPFPEDPTWNMEVKGDDSDSDSSSPEREEDEGDAPDVERWEMGFDFETVHMEDAVLHPYNVSYAVKRDIGQGKMEVIEVGSYTDASLKTCVTHLLDWMEEKVRNAEFAHQQDPTRHPRVKWTAWHFNGARFDVFLMLEEMVRRGMGPRDAFMARGSILKAKYMGIIFLDLYRFAAGSLKKLCADYRCQYSKLQLDHQVVQTHYEQGTLDSYLQEHREEVENYSKMDVLAMLELQSKIRYDLQELLGQDMNKSLTLSGVVWKAFQASEHYNKVKPPHTQEAYDFVRKACYGGRVQLFQGPQIIEDEQVCTKDKNGLYPFVALDPNCFYPAGDMHFTKQERTDGKIGVYMARVTRPPTAVVVPCRGDTLDWSKQAAFGADQEAVPMFSMDIQTLRDLGATVRTSVGYYWDEARNDLFPFLAKLVRAKEEEDVKLEREKKGIPHPEGVAPHNPSRRQTAKTSGNSFLGKTMQRVYKDTTAICQTYEHSRAFVAKHDHIELQPLPRLGAVILKGQRKNWSYFAHRRQVHPVQIGGSNYTHARRDMLLGAISRVPKEMLFYTDTDCVKMLSRAVPLLEAMEEERRRLGTMPPTPYGAFLLGTRPGEYKEETENCHYAVFVGPKVYKMIGRDDKGNIVIYERWKGVGNDKLLYDKTPTFKSHREWLALPEGEKKRLIAEVREGMQQAKKHFLSLTHQEKSAFYAQAPACTGIQSHTHEDVVRGFPVIIVSSSIRRFFGHQGGRMEMRQAFLLKEYGMDAKGVLQETLEDGDEGPVPMAREGELAILEMLLEMRRQARINNSQQGQEETE